MSKFSIDKKKEDYVQRDHISEKIVQNIPQNSVYNLKKEISQTNTNSNANDDNEI